MRLAVTVLLATALVVIEAAPYKQRQYYPAQSGYYPASFYYAGDDGYYSADNNNFFPLFGSAYPYYSGYNRRPATSAAYRPTGYRYPVGSLGYHSAAIPGVLGFPRPFNPFASAAEITQTKEEDVEPVPEVVEPFEVEETAAEPVPVEMPVIAVEVDQPEDEEFLPVEPVPHVKIEKPVAADEKVIEMVPIVITPLVEDVVQVDPLPVAESERKPEKDVDPGTNPGQFGPVSDVQVPTKGQQVKVAVVAEKVKVAEPVEQEKVAEPVVTAEEVKVAEPAVEQEKVAEPVPEPEPVAVDETKKKTSSECKVEYVLVSDSSSEVTAKQQQQQQQQQ